MLSKYILPRWVIYIILILSGAASFYYIPTLFGIDFLIGSFLTFLLYRLFGFRIALIHSMIFAFATYYIWGHFYGSAAMLMEFLTVILLYKKYKQSLIMADMIYWLTLGIPFVFVTYYYLLDLSFVDSLIVALKDTVNGIINILLANLLLFIVSYFFFKKHRQKIQLEDVIFHTILTLFLIPAFTMLLFEMSSDSEDVQQQIQSDSQKEYTDAQDTLNMWMYEVRTVLSSQGNFVYSADVIEDELYLATLSEAVWGADEIVLMDSDMNVIADYPENRLNTLNESNYPDFMPNQVRYSPFYFDANNDPYVIATIPLTKPSEFTDEETLYFAVSIEMKEWENLYGNDRRVTVHDQSGMRMDGTANPDDDPFFESIQSTFNQGNEEELSFLWMPSDTDTKISSWKNATYVTMGENENTPWTVISTVNTGPYHKELFTQHLYRLIFISIILAFSIFLSTKITKKILRPIHELELITKNLPERVKDSQSIVWPRTRLIDVQLLIINFRKMTRKLSKAFDEVSDQQNKLSRLAKFDPLTNLQNRMGIDESFQEHMSPETALGIMFMDLDHFKKVNDTLGHGVGDLVLVEVASKLIEVSSAETTVGRLGGDEFILLVPDTSEEDLRKFSSAILKVFKSPLNIDGHMIAITPSIGLALAPDHGTELTEVMQNADIALYESKRNGKNQATFFNNYLNIENEKNQIFEQRLRNALKENLLTIHYDPIYKRNSADLTSAAAKITWPHGEMTIAQWRTLSKSVHLSKELGNYIVNKAIADASKLSKEGYHIDIMLPLLIDQCYDPKFFTSIEKLLKKYEVNGCALRFVLSEHIPPAEMSFFNDLFKQLNQIGIKIVLDEFGVGYSALLYMNELPIDQIKINAQVLEKNGEKQAADHIVKGVMSIAGSMGLKTIAVNIKNKKQEAFFEEQNADEVQFSNRKPINITELKKRLENEKIS
ncbi:putative bifunctional diguanylate cyclase/phosphodiesterase [Jeotgalibacillus salarius]|uniref:Diguanylate cyclase n=1 Tax=Jeotgalibacillus salarius TaxID=546023 RepID=A0A4Y8LD97_9BACL|nr:diguanylate cyclase [Jeotgalibacillus salarius]TFE00598.1 diguanylate cyclase [Jeotgalibacillus salarius]